MRDTSTKPTADLLAVAGWPRGRTWLIELRGELDISCRQLVHDEFARATPSSCRRVVVDARGVTFVDGGGLEVLLSAATTFEREVWLRAPSRAVQRVVELAGLAPVWAQTASGDDVRIA
jgi:anti-anti-sigma factor